MRRCVRHSKKRTQASPDQAVGDPTRAQRPVVRVEDGRDPGPLRGALRSEERPVVCFDERPCQLCWPRCESHFPSSPASHSVSTPSMSGGVWPKRAHGLRSPQGSKRDEGDRAPPKVGVRRHDALPPRRSLPRGRANPLGGRQPQHAFTGVGFNRSVQHGRFWVLSGPEVQEWRGWVVQEGCRRRARRSCGSGGEPGSPSATSPGHYTSLPAPFTGCSKLPAASLHRSGAGG